MKVTVFSSQAYEQDYLRHAVSDNAIEFDFVEARLDARSALMAQGADAVCVFVNDCVDSDCLEALHNLNIKHVALRCAGFNNVDIAAAKRLGVIVSRVPAYSPASVAEHTLALALTLNRRLHKAYNRVKDNNFTLNGLMGFNLKGKTVGIIGTGKIGEHVAKLFNGFGCQLLAYDPYPNPALVDLGVHYTELEQLYQQSDIISLHCPLTAQSQHLINADSLAQMKTGVMIINTSRGALIDTQAVINALKQKKVGHLALDVYEMESELFFADHSSEVIQDDVFQRLLTFPNVLITGHQGFFTHEAMTEIAKTTVSNLRDCHTDKVTPDNLLS